MADEVKKYISEITLPNGNKYYIKDQEARDKISDLEEAIKGGMHYIGATTTSLSDGAHNSTVAINGETVTPKAGDIVTNGSKEYVWDGVSVTVGGVTYTGTWHELGDLTGLGEFAYADTGSVKIKPKGTVTKPTFTGSESSVTVTYAKNTSGAYQITGTVSKPNFTGTEADVAITVTEKTDGNYTPAGTVSKPTFTGSSSNVSFTIAANSNGNYTPTGSVSQPTFTGDELISTGKLDIPTSATTVTATTTNKTATVSPAASGTVTYTPAGTITNVGITYNTKTITPIKSVGTPPELTMSVADNSENLVITWDAGTTSEKDDAVTVVTGTKSITQPTFSGTGVRLVTGNIAVPATYTTTLITEEKTVTVKGTPTGTVSQPTFSGTKVLISGSTTAAGSVSKPDFTGTTVDITGKTTAAGSVSQPTFTGDKFNLSGKTTAAGSVSQPTFNGTEETITVNPVKKTT